MKLGLQLNSFDGTGGPERCASTLEEIARDAEEARCDNFAVTDHVWQHPIMGGPRRTSPSATRCSRSSPPTRSASSSRPWCREYISSRWRHAAETAGPTSNEKVSVSNQLAGSLFPVSPGSCMRNPRPRFAKR
jgi:hypothetical protein